MSLEVNVEREKSDFDSEYSKISSVLIQPGLKKKKNLPTY